MIYVNYEQLDNKIGRACHEEYALTYEQIKGYINTSDKVSPDGLRRLLMMCPVKDVGL